MSYECVCEGGERGSGEHPGLSPCEDQEASWGGRDQGENLESREAPWNVPW